MLAGMPLSVIIDRTTHRAAAGWLLGLQDSGLGELVGRPMQAQAQQPLVIPLSQTLEAALPLERYLNFDGTDRPDPRVLPDRFVIIKPHLTGPELIARLADAKKHYAAALPPRPPESPRPSPPPSARTRRIAALITAYALARDLLKPNTKQIDILDQLLSTALTEANQPNAPLK